MSALSPSAAGMIAKLSCSYATLDCKGDVRATGPLFEITITDANVGAILLLRKKRLACKGLGLCGTKMGIRRNQSLDLAPAMPMPRTGNSA